ncbi:hypothetical protein KUTeg_004496 [Tegillarca granosa]|uniref:RUN domain-containing protein n=1 Tax=Tegillarca granosa TaxID=220873 RepID=A0ABQ9FSZ6_TEGGR|nr:hypothetical protein KUTeg_004496 [Tegillarca granosa]
MSVSDPLLRRLKGLVLEIRMKNEIVTDKSAVLQPLCVVLEEIYRKGIKYSGWFRKSDYWTWINKVASIPGQRINPVFSIVVESIRECKKVHMECGRGRLFLRAALMKKVVSTPIQMLMALGDKQFIQEWYDENDSILGNEILTEILLSLLRELSKVTFKLTFKNASFLDNTWELPVYKQYELVPCSDLGLHVQLCREYLVVTSVVPDSVADEDGKIGPGDILDELYGESLRGAKQAKKAKELLEQYQGLPVHLNIIKPYSIADEIYRPIYDLLEEANINIKCDKNDNEDVEKKSTKKPPHAILPEEDDDEVPVHGSDGGAVYEVEYLGRAVLGRDGRVQRIEDSVAIVLRNPTEKMAVKIDMSEKDVLVIDRSNGRTVLHHTYTEISACGRRTDAMKYVGYIAGETTCSLAQDFMCHVFECQTEQQHKDLKELICYCDILHQPVL